MVNSDLTNEGVALDPEVALALAYASMTSRPGLDALFALDRRLGLILRTTTEPMIGQMRLTWWHDAVGRDEPIAGEPVLAAVRAARLAPARLQTVVEGWEALLDGDDAASLRAYADARGGGLFAAAAAVLGTDADVADAGAGWALVDLARHHSRAEVRARALALAGERLRDAPRRWPRPARPLGMLAKLARRDLDGPEPQGSPRRIVALAALALTGR